MASCRAAFSGNTSLIATISSYYGTAVKTGKTTVGWKLQIYHTQSIFNGSCDSDPAEN